MTFPYTSFFFILNYAKLRMLEFYYNCLCKYIPRNKFECVQMDTDSLYFALAHENLLDAVYPQLKDDFDNKINGKCSVLQEADSDTFFPRMCCHRDSQFDKRTPALYKTESTGRFMIALCSKPYVIDNEGQYKLSCKGVNKKSISNPVSVMSNVLQSHISQSSVNRGFRAKDNTMYTYSQQRIGFNYFHGKRVVQEDGIHTAPLDLVLSPWPDFKRHIFAEDPLNPLCNSFSCALHIQDFNFISIDHFIVYSLVAFHQGEEQASAVQKLNSPSEIFKF